MNLQFDDVQHWLHLFRFSPLWMFTLNGIVHGLIQNVGFKILLLLPPIWAAPDVGTDDGPLCAEVKEGQVHADEENTNTRPRKIQIPSRGKYRYNQENTDTTGETNEDTDTNENTPFLSEPAWS